MGMLAVKDSVLNWRRQGYVDGSGVVKKWKPRKKEVVPKRSVLVLSGALRRSPRYMVTGPLSADIINEQPYALRHNEGLDGMPERRHVNLESKALHDDIDDYFDTQIIKGFLR